MPGYQFVSQPSLSNAGGVGFYILDQYSFSFRSDLSKSESGFEALWIEIENDTQGNLLCGVIYRHPHGNIDSFMDYLNSTVEKSHRERKMCVLMGDFNLDLLKFETHKETDDFLNTMLTTNFLPQILQPTRITDHSATLIDNIFLNIHREMFTISGNLIYDLTDHLPSFLITCNYACLPNKIKMFKRDYSNFNEAAFIRDCQSVNWEGLVSTCSDANHMFNSFYAKLSEIVDTHVPVKQIPKKELKLRLRPWITPAIKKSIQIKNNLYKKFLKTKLLYYHSKFKYYRNKLNHLIKISKKQYYTNYFNLNHGNPKQIWTGIKRIITHKTKCSYVPSKIRNNNTDITDPKAIADAFNNYFSNVGWNLANSVPNTENTPQQYLNNQAYDTFYLFPTSVSEIETEISNINVRKATGPYSIPPNILKLVKCVISKPLEIIFNISFATGVVPDKFKIARVLPVFKNGLKMSLNNYRPISLLSVFNRIMEKLMYTRLINFIDKMNIIYAKQFGFRSHHSQNMQF